AATQISSSRSYGWPCHSRGITSLSSGPGTDGTPARPRGWTGPSFSWASSFGTEQFVQAEVVRAELAAIVPGRNPPPPRAASGACTSSGRRGDRLHVHPVNHQLVNRVHPGREG